MILLWVFFDFGVEVLEGFEAWFLQSFCTSESWSLFKCLRNASICRSLGVGERHVAESDWWHMSQPDWSTYVIAYTCWTACVIAYMRWTACVIAYTCWTACVIAYTRWCVIGFLHDTWQISIGFWVVIAKLSSNTWCFVIGCILWTW